MPKNDYARRITEAHRNEINMAFQWGSQLTCDINMILLNRRFGIGKKRLMKFFEEDFLPEINRYMDCLVDVDDADYLRADIDRALSQILGPNVEPWESRYDCWNERRKKK